MYDFDQYFFELGYTGPIDPHVILILLIGLIVGVSIQRWLRRFREAVKQTSSDKTIQEIEKQWARDYWKADEDYKIALRGLEKGNTIVIPIIHDLGNDQSVFGWKRDKVPVEIGYDEALVATSKIRQAPTHARILVVVHTPGGYIRPSQMIATALKEHSEKKAKLFKTGPDTQVCVPYMALSGGTIIALAANTILMGKNAELGPTDPVVYGFQASSFRKLLDERSQGQLIEGNLALMAYEAEKYMKSARSKARKILNRCHELSVADRLSIGEESHSHAFDAEGAKKRGIQNIKEKLPSEAYDLVDAQIRKLIALDELEGRLDRRAFMEERDGEGGSGLALDRQSGLDCGNEESAKEGALIG